MDDLFESTWLIYYLSKVFGQANIRVTGPVGKRYIRGCYGSQIYSLVIHSVATAASVYAQYIQKTNFKSQQKLVTVLQDNVSILLTMFSALFNIYHIKKQLAVNKKLIFVDKELTAMDIEVKHKKLRIYIYIIMSIQYSLMLGYHILILGLIREFHLEKLLYLICTLFRKNARVITAIQIQVWSILLKERFNLLKENLREVGRNNKCHSLLRRIVKTTARLHQELCWITRNMNDIYAVQCLTSTGLTFVTFVRDLYNLFLMFDSGDFEVLEFVLICYSVLNGIVHFTMVLYHCTTVADKVSMVYKWKYNSILCY